MKKLPMGLAGLLVASTAAGGPSPPKLPSDAVVGRMFEHSADFMRVCGPAISSGETSDEWAHLASMCMSFAVGVGTARAIADRYEINGTLVCAQPAPAKEVMNEAFAFYRGSEEARNLSPAVLLIVAQARIAPCK